MVCSSDIIESCFGKYKEAVKLNKTIGVSDICLSISCLTNNGEIKELKKALETIKINDVKKWSDENIGETLFKKEQLFIKKIGRRKILNLSASGKKSHIVDTPT